MKIEVITIGDEILSGAITDTNFAWLGDQLWGRGYELHWHTSVADEPDKIRQVLKAAVGRSEAVIVTGGLGPTIDDITLETASKAFGVPWVRYDEAIETMRRWFEKRGRPMDPKNEKQAFFPQGGTIIPNIEGTALGCHFLFKKTHYFFLPGVPREMKRQVEDWVLPFLAKNDPRPRQYAFRLLRTFGLPEAGLAQKLDDLDLAGADLSYRVSFPEILLKISTWGEDKAALEEKVGSLERKIRERLGIVVYAEGKETFPAVVGRLLKEKGETLSVAESCTGGRLASLITDVPGSSAYFERGVVTYSNQSKTELLRVPEKILREHGAVSSEAAIAMAAGMRRLAKTTYSLAITGIAGPSEGLTSPPPRAKPDGASPSTPSQAAGWSSKPVGTVHIALDSAEGATEKKLFFATNREWFKHLAAFAALDILRKKLLKTA